MQTHLIPPVLLASKSPRRLQLLQQTGLTPTLASADADETPPAGMAVLDVPQHLAQVKGEPFLAQSFEKLVIAADTLVFLDGEILGKPVDEADAQRMLMALCGRTHTVVTGVWLAWQGRTTAFSDSTQVHVAPYSAADAAFYIQHYRPMDKAGAYGVQDWYGLNYVTGLTGCYFNVMGLPVPRLMAELRNWLTIS